MNAVFRTLALAVICLSLSSHAAAESAWVTDQFEITLRSGPSTSNAIQLMVSSGTELEVLERDGETGYTRVRTQGGTEGWVLSRYLMTEPSAREQLQALSSQLTSANTRGSSLNTQLAAVRSEYETAQNRIQQLERDNSRLEQELAEIRRTAANVLSINEQNKALNEAKTDLEIQVTTLETQVRDLQKASGRQWLMTGGAIMLIGILLGLWLPRINWRRRSRYDSF
ncbi:MAG: TIGR04211 family SH3 domain-containing protein [Woeseiaceae bacterium]|nr:TIGR04211 family SH3 domain-containing protein [Woeseiaceae bacterium]